MAFDSHKKRRSLQAKGLKWSAMGSIVAEEVRREPRVMNLI
jgi:hypothetical protein